MKDSNGQEIYQGTKVIVHGQWLGTVTRLYPEDNSVDVWDGTYNIQGMNVDSFDLAVIEVYDDSED